MDVDRLDTNALYIASNTPDILHATLIGKHANPPVYKSNGMGRNDCQWPVHNSVKIIISLSIIESSNIDFFADWCGDTRCIESCPFDQPFFMVMCNFSHENFYAILE